MKRYDLKPKGEKPAVLDIGCGNTPMENATVIMDIDKTIKGKLKDKKFAYHDANLLPYPFKNNTFDYIYLNNIIEHLTVGDSLLFK